MSRLIGSCYGYGVRSDLPLNSLRAGGGDPLEVALRDYDFEPRGAPLRTWNFQGEPLAQAWADNGGYKMAIEDVQWFSVDPQHNSITIPSSLSLPLREFRLWRLPIALCFKQRGDIALHAAAVDVAGGGAVLFTGPTRHGKSTLSAAFLRAGHRLLTEDLCCVRPSPEPVIFPGPAQLRVRRDVVDQIELSGARIVDEWTNQVLYELDEDRRGDGSAVPLRGIVFLRISDGPPRLSPRKPLEVTQDLWALSTKLPVENDQRHLFGALVDLANSVPAWDLDRRLSLAELPQVVDLIVETCLR